LEASGIIRAAGGVPWRRRADGQLEFLLVHRARYDDWTFPKGKAKDSECDEEAAIREVEEETGLTCELGNELATTHYVDRRGRSKYVRYWTMGPVTAATTPGQEIDRVEWLTRDSVARRLSYERDIAVLDSFAESA
jgi:8-oxo-dGTP pyrophosphatase MutT (NUDIX family)